MRILWVSRHPPLYKQIKELERIFGNVEIVQFAGFVKDAEHIIQLMKIYEADDVAVVLPLSMIYRLVEDYHVHPIFPEMELLPNGAEQYDYEDPKSKRKYRFKQFVRIKAFDIVKEPLDRR